MRKDFLDKQINDAKLPGDGIVLTVSILRTPTENEEIKYILESGFVVDDILFLDTNPEIEMIIFRLNTL